MPAFPSPALPPSALPCTADTMDDFLARPTPQAVAVVARTPGPFLVLGAGGKLGLHLCGMLRQALNQLGRNDRVIAVSRFSSLRDAGAFTRRGIEAIPCDLGDAAALRGLPEAPVVFFLAGVKFGTAAAPELLRLTNVEIPGRVARRFPGSRLVAFSSGNIYPFVTPESGGATEATPPAPIGDYAISCLAREAAFTAGSREHHTPGVLVRLNYAVEFRYGLLIDLAEAVLAGKAIDVTTGYVNVIWQTDAVAHAIQSLELARTPPVPINVTGAGILRVRDLAQRFGAALNRPVHLTGTEAPTALLNDARESHRRFGAPATSVEQMIAWIAAWLGHGGKTWGKPTGFERRDGCF
jgi:nucleoside-diphosphate-sugar epimerase